jgi:hypothetical protein
MPLPNIKLSIGIQNRNVEARILRRMPFLTQPSPFPGLGLAPPMAPITVEAGDVRVEGSYNLSHLYHSVLTSMTSSGGHTLSSDEED